MLAKILNVRNIHIHIGANKFWVCIGQTTSVFLRWNAMHRSVSVQAIKLASDAIPVFVYVIPRSSDGALKNRSRPVPGKPWHATVELVDMAFGS